MVMMLSSTFLRSSARVLKSKALVGSSPLHVTRAMAGTAQSRTSAVRNETINLGDASSLVLQALVSFVIVFFEDSHCFSFPFFISVVSFAIFL
jgi:hypothetical protein